LYQQQIANTRYLTEVIMEIEEVVTNGAENCDITTEAAKNPSVDDVKTEPVAAGDQDDPDPVVHEIPVFLAKGIQNLYLFQYPVRPAHMPYDGVEVSNARVRPNNKQVELELRINTTNANYDRSKGEQIALNVDGATTVGGGPAREDRPKVFQSTVMDKQVLVGSSAVSRTGRYAVGLLDDNELHLTRLEGVLSLRPSLGYLDKSDTRAKAEGRMAADPDDPVEPTDVKPEPVTVKFARGDPERNKKYKEKSYDYQKKIQEEEPWVNTRFNQMKGKTWDVESQRMFCSAMDTDVREMDLGPGEYLLSLKDGTGS